MLVFLLLFLGTAFHQSDVFGTDARWPLGKRSKFGCRRWRTRRTCGAAKFFCPVTLRRSSAPPSRMPCRPYCRHRVGSGVAVSELYIILLYLMSLIVCFLCCLPRCEEMIIYVDIEWLIDSWFWTFIMFDDYGGYTMLYNVIQWLSSIATPLRPGAPAVGRWDLAPWLRGSPAPLRSFGRRGPPEPAGRGTGREGGGGGVPERSTGRGGIWSALDQWWNMTIEWIILCLQI